MNTKHIDYLRYGLFTAGLTIAVLLLSFDTNLQGNLLGILPDDTGEDGETLQIEETTYNIPLNGAVIDLTTLSSEEVLLAVEAFQELGMNTLIIEKTRTKSEAAGCQSTAYEWYEDMQEKLDTVFEATTDSSVSIYIGLVSTYGACSDVYTDKNILSTAKETANMVTYYNTEYRDFDSLAGYYLPDALTNFYFEKESREYLYYERMAQAVHDRSDKPVLTSANLAGIANHSGTKSPVEAAEQANRILSSGIDVLVIHDDVALGTNLGWNHTAEFPIGDYYEVITADTETNSVWSSHDLRNCCGVPDEDSNLTQSASITRIKMQLDQISDIDGVKLVWGNWPLITSGEQIHDVERLQDGLKAAYGDKPTFQIPEDYSYTTPPMKGQVDMNKLLIDGVVGDANSIWLNRRNNHTTREWVGFEGDVEIIIDLGRIYPVNWVGLHVLHKDSEDIQIPESVTIAVSQDNINWEPQGEWEYPVKNDKSENVMKNGEYLSGNMDKLEAGGRFIKVRLRNAHHTYASEIEVIVGE